MRRAISTMIIVLLLCASCSVSLGEELGDDGIIILDEEWETSSDEIDLEEDDFDLLIQEIPEELDLLDVDLTVSGENTFDDPESAYADIRRSPIMRIRRIIALMLSLLLVSVAALAEDAVYTIADPTYVRSAPGIDGERRANLRPDSIYGWGGHTVVDDRGVAWFDVFYGNNYGWVSSLHADLYDRRTGEFSYYVNYPAPDDTTVFAKRDMDVYSGPSTETYFNGTLSKGESAIFTGFREKDSKGNEWLQIRYNWKRGWVRSKYAEIY